MATLNEPVRLTDWLKYEAEGALYSRDEVTVAEGQDLASGTVVGRVTVGEVTGEAWAGNAANTGTIGTLSAGTGARPGVYQAVCIEPATNAGKFAVYDPDGKLIGVATVAVEFAGEVVFTIADGSTDFSAGEGFDITVADGTGHVKVSAATAADGSDAAVGVLVAAVDASAAAAKGVIIARHAVVIPHGLTYDSSVDDATKKAAKHAQLAALGILVREGA